MSSDIESLQKENEELPLRLWQTEERCCKLEAQIGSLKIAANVKNFVIHMRCAEEGAEMSKVKDLCTGILRLPKVDVCNVRRMPTKCAYHNTCMEGN